MLLHSHPASALAEPVKRIAMLNLYLAVAFLFASAVSGPLSHAADNDRPPDHLQGAEPLRQLIVEGFQNNLDIAALQRQIAARRQELRAAGTWEDPVVGLGLLNLPVNSFDFNQEPMTQKQVSISQRIPWFGTLDLKTRRVALDVMQLETMLTAKKLALARDLAQVWYQLGITVESQAINDAMIGKMDQMVRIAETNYATGAGLQQDVLQAQVEQSRLIDTRITLEKDRRTLEDRIQALLNRPSFRAPGAPALSGLPSPAIESGSFEAIAARNNPELVIRRIEADMAGVEVELARKRYWPDPNIQLAYGQRDDDPLGNSRDDFVSASISFSVPIWARNKQNAQLEAALDRQRAARMRIEDLATRLPHQIDALVHELRQLRMNRDLVHNAMGVQAEQWAQSAMAAYQVGKADFNTMLNAHLRQLALERQSSQYLYRYHQKLAELDQIIGGGLLVPGQGEFDSLLPAAAPTPSNHSTKEESGR
jgi:outer membrane protein TolC